MNGPALVLGEMNGPMFAQKFEGSARLTKNCVSEGQRKRGSGRRHRTPVSSTTEHTWFQRYKRPRSYLKLPAVYVFENTTSGELFDYSKSQFPSKLFGWNAERLNFADHSTSYGFIADGQAELSWNGKRFDLHAGMYFCVPGKAVLSGSGSGFIALRLGYLGLFQLGGPIEQTGRLRYIDGCSDTLLIGPPVLGDPCLNLLHIPPQTKQTAHTHPTERLGMVTSGNGVCRTPDREIQLQPGLIFAIDAGGVHSFNTESESLKVIAWHPDSDCGPQHNDHPMINRTVVDGVSAAKIPDIATRGVPGE